MQFILKYVDLLWNLKFIKGHRTQIARAVLAVVAGYQWLSTAKEVISIIDLPELSPVIASGIIGYIALKIEQFAKEHA